jgi:hemoglobin/transferrin/lactoferrin receptor protein
MALRVLARIARSGCVCGSVAVARACPQALGTAALAASCILALPQQAVAQTAPASAQAKTFNIPAQPLASAISAFIKASGWQVGYSSSLAANAVSQPVSGTMPPQTALETLLAGTNITLRITGPATATLVAADASTDGASVDGAIALDTIDVSGGSSATGAGFQGTPDWVYETPASVSVVTSEALKKVPARNTRDAIANAPGVYAGEGNGSFPTVSPNIRGLQDSGRIIVSIDGARQNAQRGFGAGSSGYQANSGQAFVDTAFVREVDISKNPDAKSGNAGSLGGTVNFRTIRADDLIPAGDKWGMEANITRGDNEYNFQGSALMATRIGESLALTMGVSRTDLGKYLPGQNGGEIASSGSFKGREAWSSFLKFEGEFGDVKTFLSWMHQENDFRYLTNAYPNEEIARNDSVTAQALWKPDNPLIDARASIWLSDSGMNEVRPQRPSYVETEIDSGFLSVGGVLENTSRIDTAAGALKLNYGAEAFRDDARSSASSTSIAQNPTWASSFTSFAPAGQRDVASSFLNGELKPAEWVTVSGGVRYDWSRLRGSPTYYERRPATFVYAQCVTTQYDYYAAYNPALLASLPPFLQDLFKNICGQVHAGQFYTQGQSIDALGTPQQDVGHKLDIDRADGAWLPSATIEFKPVDWFRPFVSYSQSYRPPSIVEAFFSGGLPNDGLGLSFAPNGNLRSEKAQTWEVGANVIGNGIFDDQDSFRFKAVAFDRSIDDFIVLGSIVTQEATTPFKTYTSFVNFDEPTKMRGVEIEANYDIRFAWIGAGLSLLETEWPKRTETFSNGVTTTDGQVIAVAGTVAPEYKLILDGGVRLVDERLVLGARYSRVGPTQVNRADLNLGGDLVISDNSRAYSLVDLYGSFTFNDNTTARFAINNLTDINYIPATSAYNAPGRTISVGYQIRY